MLFKYETERLILKVLKPDSAAQVLDFYERDRDLFELYETDRMPEFYTVKHQQAILKYEYNLAFKTSAVRFYVFLKDNPLKIIGTVCLHSIALHFYGSCELGYKFSSEYHHKGYATEAIERCLQIIFEELDLHRVNAYVCDGNTPSMKLLTRLGFKPEGICREYLLLHGKWHDHVLYSLLESDTPYISSKQYQ